MTEEESQIDEGKGKEGPEQSTRKLVEPSKIDIYANLTQPHKTDNPPQQSLSLAYLAVLSRVSAVRQFFGQYSDGIQTKYTTIKTNTSNAAINISAFVNTAREDPSILAKPGLIATAFTVGLLAPGRGRKPLHRLFFSTCGGAIAAGACYPKETMEASKQEFAFVKESGVKLLSWSQFQKDDSTEAPDGTETEQVREPVTEIKEITDTPPESKTESTPQ